MDDELNKLGSDLSGKLGSALAGFTVTHSELTLDVVRDKICDVITTLRDDADCRFVCLADICGVDYPEREERALVAGQLFPCCPPGFCLSGHAEQERTRQLVDLLRKMVSVYNPSPASSSLGHDALVLVVVGTGC